MDALTIYSIIAIRKKKEERKRGKKMTHIHIYIYTKYTSIYMYAWKFFSFFRPVKRNEVENA